MDFLNIYYFSAIIQLYTVMSQENISKGSFKDDQVNDLMKSIQNKLSMLACEDSLGQFQSSKLDSPKRQFLTATNQKKYKNRMNIHDLETSHRKQTKQSPSRLGQSRILTRINQMQHFYMDQIQQMSSRVASLEFELETITKQKEELKNQNIVIKHQLSRKQREQNEIVNLKLEELKSQLISKFTKEAEEHFEKHIKQMKAVSEQLLEQKGKRKYLEQEVSLLKNEKNSLQQFYRNLLQNHRQMIKMDIIKSQKAQHEHSVHSAFREKTDEDDTSTTKKKGKKKDKSNVAKKSEELSKQEMIPFLAKGIQELKDKLKIK